MGKYLNTEYVDQVEFYLAANNLTVKDYQKAPYRYPLWNKEQIDLFCNELGLKKDFLGAWSHFESEPYQKWLLMKYGHLFKSW